jgi:hypothetical protein
VQVGVVVYDLSINDARDLIQDLEQAIYEARRADDPES